MARLIFALILITTTLACGSRAEAKGDRPMEDAPRAEVLVGATDTAQYMPLLRGKRVAVLANHTAMFSPEEHIVDMMHREGINLVGIFAPEHGFRGAIEAGEVVRNSTDERTGVPILSLYTGTKKRPSDEVMRSFDMLVVDMQDVGLRFYTYYITMLQIMEVCAEYGQEVVILDRPNPNGHYVDGPILDMRYKSGVGWLPIPVVHGLTMGEIANMAVGKGWTPWVPLHVVRCRNYDHSTHYQLPIAPSPNLPTQHSIYLYPTTCLFEGTVMSMGRGTDAPFEIYGHPDMRGCSFTFTPEPNAGSKTPPYEGELCHGVDMRGIPVEDIWAEGIDLECLVEAYHNLAIGEKFFKPVFEKLIGVDYVRQMILSGASADEIEARWVEDVERFKIERRDYLLYAE